MAFWITKGLSTALGESTSDYSVHAIAPQIAVIGGFAAFVAALVIQLRQRRYQRWTYWLAVAMVGVFGTMAADVLHVGLGVPYPVSSLLYGAVLAAVFVSWRATEHTLSIHTINTTGRELFYWATVVTTFATGTAVGDYTALTLHLGYFPSAALFAGLILIPAIGYRWLRWNPVACFWAAYVLTRPLGASIADGLGKPRTDHGLGFGAGPVAAALVGLMILMVAALALTGRDIQTATAPAGAGGAARPAEAERAEGTA